MTVKVIITRNQFEKLRPLTYDELAVDRANGRWANEPEKVVAFI